MSGIVRPGRPHHKNATDAVRLMQDILPQEICMEQGL